MNSSNNEHPEVRPQREEKRRILIVTDGTVTECGYFEKVKKLSLDVIEIAKRGSKDIDKLVDLAIQRRNRGDYDVVSVVCDIDDRLISQGSRSTLDTAIQEAYRNNIMICLSHESFEVWLLAHAGTVPSAASKRKIASAEAAKRGLVKGRRNKEIVDSKITCESIKCAMKEAERLRATYGNDILKDSPNTDVDKLFRKIQLK